MTEVHGFCDERFQPLADAFRHNLESGLDKGASVAVAFGDEMVVDLWGGTRDYDQSVPWEHDTLVRVFSTSKVMVVLSALLLVDRGALDLDAPIATYWPEFAHHGKDTVTTRHVMVHRSGLPGFGRRISFEEMADWDTAVSILENAEPWYEPGTTSCYHPFTFGQLIGEVIHRITEQPFVEFFRREIAEPLDADFHFGLPETDAHRVAALWPNDGDQLGESEMGRRVMREPESTTEWIEPSKLPAVIPSTSGITNARAIARIGSIISMNGTVGDRRFLDIDVVEEAVSEQSNTVDEVIGPVRYGLGFGLHHSTYPSPTPTTVHWGGYGGSFASMDPATGITCGYAPNQLRMDYPEPDPRRRALWVALGEITRELG